MTQFRAAFIDIARTELLSPGRPDTDARLALLTGLTKREVNRIRTSGLGEDDSVGLSRIARVLQGWSQDPEFLGPYGLPLEIPFAGDRLSFSQLVARYAGDVDPALLLEELTRAGAALETADHYVRLLNRTYLPSPLDPSGLERIGNVVGYFIRYRRLQPAKEASGRRSLRALRHNNGRRVLSRLPSF